MQTVLLVLEHLASAFGFSNNEKGFQVLNPHVRVIQGDGIDYEEIDKILTAMKQAGWSADNIAFGCGGALLQKLNRDTQKFAFKCSSVLIDGLTAGYRRDVYKDPITDSGKQSKRGQFNLIKSSDGKYKTERYSFDERNDCLKTVFSNGVCYEKQSLSGIRKVTNAEGW